MKSITFTLIDSIGETHYIETKPNSYESLMALIVNELYETIGDCKGRAWCGTCIVRQVKGHIIEAPLSLDEQKLLNQYPNPEHSPIRLSCQILINSDLEQTCWEIVDSRLSM
ncbi:2Fe-2S iron-sulfur cluster-binding protein [Formosa haliotis]|uniref:2Fe-2S iron-sulfur cluster-binding protein n=1 Tax=Formosa haliotis TaxID=1555194 RepID=UPI000826BA9F|nr:2Fe-2S iron-sulfur cluster-binding protein [Formosa haliotis]